MSKRNVYLCQANSTYGRNSFLPYSVGLLHAYALTFPEIKEAYNFAGYVYLREPIADVVARWQNPSVAAFSMYIWNANYTLALAKAVKEANPDCLIVIGGPHVPNASEPFLRQNPFVDLVVHGEGEETFAEILKQHCSENFHPEKILGISFLIFGYYKKTADRPRFNDLDKIPSPYLTGIFDDFPFDKYEFHPTQETHRGCPFSCSFCDWGSNLMAKVKRFSDERIIQEFEWMAKHKLDLLYNADANWGMFERDVGLAQRLVEIKNQYGYPRKFRAAYAKNSGDRVHTISKILNDAGMSKGATLSFQSMDANTLDIVKRKNIGIEVFKKLMQTYRKEGIPTYSELIIGLPGETYQTFAQGLNTLVDAGQHSSLQVYICECLPNSEMSLPSYRQAHGIQTAHVPVLFFHGTPQEDPHQEYYELVTSTKVLPPEDWHKCLMLAWAFQTFHCLGLTQAIAVYWRHKFQYEYHRFYEALLDFAAKNPVTLLGSIYREVSDLFAGIPEGKGWGIIDQRFGNIMWPPEEGAFLKIAAEAERFYEELEEFIPFQNVISYQRAIAKTPTGPKEIELAYQIPEYIESCYESNPISLKDEASYYRVLRDRDWDNLEDYAREVAWYGRKGGSFQHKVERLC